MRFTTFKDYELLDASNGERLERWNDKILIRPDPQIIWNTEKKDPRWNQANAIYHRSSTGGGHWKIKNLKEESWNIKYDELNFNVKLMNFKHTGVFPEQAVNWEFFKKVINGKPLKILNLFGYTGCASLVCAKAGAKVCHVDASKGMVSWARSNAKDSGLENASIRWIVDDCEKFVMREIRRGNKYDGIIMDPPSYGRGPKGEIWKLEEKLYDFVSLCAQLLSDDAKFMMINSYSTGICAGAISYLMSSIINKTHKGSVLADEIGLKVSSSKLMLPAGNTCIWMSENLKRAEAFD